MRPIVKANFALALLLCTATGVAQQESKDLSETSLAELGNIQVYSASKHMQDARDAPSSVTVVTADEIQKYGYRTLADILQSVRSFYVTYDREYSFVGVRGFGRLGDWNTRVLLLVDGHRINNNVVGQAMIGSEFPVDVDMIDRVEIIRGPSSSLYGAQAFFAVINVITHKAAQLKGVELSFAPASYGTYQGRATYGGKYRGVDMLVSDTIYNSQGPTLFFPVFDTPATNNGITSNTDFERSQHVITSVSYRGLTLQGLFSSRDKGVPVGYFGALFNDPLVRAVDHHQYLDLSYQHSVGENWQLTARTSYDQVRLQAPQATPTGAPDGSTFLETFSFRGNWWDGEAKLGRTFFDKHAVTLGTEVTDNLRQDQGFYLSIGNGFRADPASSVISAFYGQDEYAILSKLTLSAGVRYDHYSNFGGTTNPRLGLIYRLFQPTTLKLLYGTAFRAPEPYETTPFAPVFDNNLQLKPETIRSEEVIVEQNIGQHFTLSGSLFRNDIDQLITLETNPADSRFVYENAGDAVAKGIEAEFTGRTQAGLQGRLSYSFTNAVGQQPNPTLANSPRHLGKLNVGAPLVGRKVFAAVDAQYTSPRLTLAGNTVSGFAVFNVTLLGHALGKHLDVSASIYNIFDKTYFDPGRPEDPEDRIEQDGRNFRIKLTGRF